MNPLDDPLEHLKSLPDRAARYEWLDGLDRIDRNRVLNRLAEEDRRRYRQHTDARVKAGKKLTLATADAARTAAAIAGRATEIGDMIQALYTVMPKLTESQRAWVERIDQAGAAARGSSRFSPRQASVIRDLYRKKFQKRP
jgi:hypothetical protein